MEIRIPLCIDKNIGYNFEISDEYVSLSIIVSTIRARVLVLRFPEVTTIVTITNDLIVFFAVKHPCFSLAGDHLLGVCQKAGATIAIGRMLPSVVGSKLRRRLVLAAVLRPILLCMCTCVGVGTFKLIDLEAGESTILETQQMGRRR